MGILQDAKATSSTWGFMREVLVRQQAERTKLEEAHRLERILGAFPGRDVQVETIKNKDYLIVDDVILQETRIVGTRGAETYQLHILGVQAKPEKDSQANTGGSRSSWDIRSEEVTLMAVRIERDHDLARIVHTHPGLYFEMETVLAVLVEPGRSINPRVIG